jgi:hypothetical protein
LLMLRSRVGANRRCRGWARRGDGKPSHRGIELRAPVP